MRNFLRVTPIDTHEVAADAVLASQLGLHRLLVVADDGTSGSAIHTPEFVDASRRLHWLTITVDRSTPDMLVTDLIRGSHELVAT